MSKQDAKVFCGGLSWETTDERLRTYFSNFGVVHEAFVSYDRHTGRPRGFGFVVFEDPLVADKVVSLQHTIDRREVEAKKAVPKEDYPPQSPTNGFHQQRTKKIFVGGLPPSVDEQLFRKYFEQYGPVEDACVMYDHDNKRPRGFGFVTFTSEESVDRVFLGGALQTIHDKPIEIKRAVPRDQMPATRTRSTFLSPQRGYGGRAQGMSGLQPHAFAALDARSQSASLLDAYPSRQAQLVDELAVQGLAHSMNSLMAQASPFAGMARVPELSQTLSPRALNGLGSGLASGLGAGQPDGPGRLHINPSGGLVGGDSHMLGMADLQASLGVQSGGHESSIDSSGSLHSFPGSGMAAHMGANAPPLGSQGSAFGSISNLTALPNSSLPVSTLEPGAIGEAFQGLSLEVVQGGPYGAGTALDTPGLLSSGSIGLSPRLSAPYATGFGGLDGHLAALPNLASASGPQW